MLITPFRRSVLGYFGLLLLILTGCAAEKPLRGRYNVLLFSIDTLRADNLGAYGYQWPTSPEIDALAAQGIVFEHPSSQAPSTLLSHAAMLTSQIPQHHGGSHIRFLPLADSVLTLAEVLKDAGYETVSFNGGGQVGSAFGFAQGFDIYEQGPDPSHWGVDHTLAWLEERRKRKEERPFFLFLHTYEVHHPYTPNSQDLDLFANGYAGPLPRTISVELLNEINRSQRQIDTDDLNFIIAAYDAEIRSVSRNFGRIIEELRREDLLEDTVIVVTSDHGEEFGEHGMVGWHSLTLYEEMLHVPLIVRLPGSRHAGERPSQRVRSIDIAPMLLDLLGLPQPSSFEGRSLVPLLGAASPLPDLPAIAMRDTPQGNIFESLTIRQVKLNEGRLFDLEHDPWELEDRAALDPSTFGLLDAELRQIVDHKPAAQSEKPIELGPEETERLKSLGYLAGPSAQQGKPQNER